MKARLALIRQHLAEAKKNAKTLQAICDQVNDEDKKSRAFEIEMGLEWTDSKAQEFQNILIVNP